MTNRKQVLIGFCIGFVVAIVLIFLMLIFKPSESKVTVSYQPGQIVAVEGTIDFIESETSSIPDAPKELKIKNKSGEEYTAKYYCGYTRSIDAVKADKDLKVGEKVEITGKYEEGNYIDVCNEKYSIKRI